jgi:hypothetical protein
MIGTVIGTPIGGLIITGAVRRARGGSGGTGDTDERRRVDIGALRARTNRRLREERQRRIAASKREQDLARAAALALQARDMLAFATQVESERMAAFARDEDEAILMLIAA